MEHVEWTKDYRDLEGKRVRLLRAQRTVGTVDGEFAVTGEIPAGTVGAAWNRSNAGFRGLEWRFVADDGRSVFNVPGCWLEVL